jgi:hypothetical protein
MVDSVAIAAFVGVFFATLFLTLGLDTAAVTGGGSFEEDNESARPLVLVDRTIVLKGNPDETLDATTDTM